MKHTLLIAAFLSLALFACKKKDEGADKTATAAEGTAKAGEPAKADEPAKGSGRKIPNSNGLVIDAPAKWLDNGIGGAAGLHIDGDGGMFQVRETSPEEAAKKLADWKADTEQVMFQKWESADETPDGWKAIYVLDKMEMKGEEMVKAGSTTAFHVRRKIGDKVHDCHGSAPTKEVAAEAVEICMKITAG
ncbi:MAG: hypothetical protein H0T42_33465 [Deltaproteobacteria bacterium]|nr:hypothetical protein [Deltaproteobacteria bacterium]